jgi:ABC-2 type transport system ATP-binding protein
MSAAAARGAGSGHWRHAHPTEDRTAMTDTIARLDGVHKRYGAVSALDGVDLVLRRGEVLALLGANGAGKTTAVSSLLGLVEPDRGRAELFGLPPRDLAARRRVGAMLQTAGVPDTLRVGELLSLFASYYAAPMAVAEVARLAGVADLLRRPYGKLSGGQQRRVQFGLALVGRPAALFLDEPTVGLDIESRQAFWAVIRAQVAAGCAVLLTTHYLEEAEALADRVSVLAGGKVIADGSVDALRARTVQRRISCRSGLDPATVALWPGVGSAVQEAGRLQITADAAEAVLRRLLAADPELAELEVRRAGLADTFIELTREAA